MMGADGGGEGMNHQYQSSFDFMNTLEATKPMKHYLIWAPKMDFVPVPVRSPLTEPRSRMVRTRLRYSYSSWLQPPLLEVWQEGEESKGWGKKATLRFLPSCTNSSQLEPSPKSVNKVVLLATPPYSGVILRTVLGTNRSARLIHAGIH